MEQFQNLLQENKDRKKQAKDKGNKETPMGSFDVHKVQRDSEGNERYIKTEEDEAIMKAKILEMGKNVAEELKDADSDKRWQWVVQTKEKGNQFFKNKELELALDEYLKCCCGLDFGKDQTKEFLRKVEIELKVPTLNNMALCLIQQNKLDRANQMLDQVLKIDQLNEKALLRKCQVYIDKTEIERAEDIIKILQNDVLQTISQENQRQQILSQIKQLKQKIKDYNQKQSTFSKNIFKQPIYEDKPCAPTKEEEEQLQKAKEIEDEIQRKQEEILDEAEHLGTLTTIQWLIYPFFKTIEMVFEMLCGGCKKEQKRIPHPDALKRPMKGE